MLFFFVYSYNKMGDIMLDQLRNYMEDNTFRFTIYENKIHIINFQKIITLEENEIAFTTKNKMVKIFGKDLNLKKLLKDELLIIGNINRIEVMDE